MSISSQNLFKTEILKYQISHKFFRRQQEMYYELSVAQTLL